MKTKTDAALLKIYVESEDSDAFAELVLAIVSPICASGLSSAAVSWASRL